MKYTFHYPVEGCITCGHKMCAKKVSLFQKLDDAQLEKIVSLIERRQYAKNEIILREGDDFDRLFIVNHGCLKVSTFNEEGKEQILYLLSDGDSIGELALLKNVKSTYELIAVKDSFICTIPKLKFDAILKENPDMIFAIFESAYDRIDSLEKLVSALASNDADLRLKYLIHRLMIQTGVQTKAGIELELQLSREDMANFVGVTRETVSRKLNQLATEGKLRFESNKRILILDNDYFSAER